MPVCQLFDDDFLTVPYGGYESTIRELGLVAKPRILTVILTLVLLRIGHYSLLPCSEMQGLWDVSAHVFKSVLSSKAKVLACMSV